MARCSEESFSCFFSCLLLDLVYEGLKRILFSVVLLVVPVIIILRSACHFFVAYTIIGNCQHNLITGLQLSIMSSCILPRTHFCLNPLISMISSLFTDCRIGLPLVFFQKKFGEDLISFSYAVHAMQSCQQAPGPLLW